MSRSILLALMVILLFAACDSTEEPKRAVSLSFSKLEPLANGFHYEGWVLFGNEPFSIGKFNIDTEGRLVRLDGSPISEGRFRVSRDLSTAESVVITIEPQGDTDAIPSGTKYLGGDLIGSTATLSVSHPAALGNTFANARGIYVLATPTNGPNTDETSGVWFLDPTSGANAPGLTLPVLPSGWNYEGWVVIDGKPVSTGRFEDANKRDKGSPFSSSQVPYSVPGEDFLGSAPEGLTFPVDLLGCTVFIAIEPTPDDSAAPFTLRPLLGTVPADAQPATVYGLLKNTASFATGTATLQ